MVGIFTTSTDCDCRQRQISSRNDDVQRVAFSVRRSRHRLVQAERIHDLVEPPCMRATDDVEVKV